MSHLQALFSPFSVHDHWDWIFYIDFYIAFAKRRKKEVTAESVSGYPVGKITQRHSRMR